MLTAQEWIETLKLEPHPEGGFFRETYRSPELLAQAALPDRFGGARHYSTAIYFLLTGDKFSALHRILSDEVWHFYAGDMLTIHQINPEGKYTQTRLGCDPRDGDAWQCVVPAGHWFGATVSGREAFALVGCTVAPGFDFADFELADRRNLLHDFPQHRDIIERLTHPS